MNIFTILSKGLFVHEILHGVFALPFAYILWRKRKNLKQIAILFLFTYLMDLDHLVDYFYTFGFSFNINNFLNGDQFVGNSYQAFIPLHGWEWAILLGILAKKHGWKSNYTTFFLSIVPHLLLDIINVKNVMFYSFFYRIINTFFFANNG